MCLLSEIKVIKTKPISDFMIGRMSLDERICRFAVVSGITFRQIVSADVREVLIEAKYQNVPSSHTTVKNKIDALAKQIFSQYQSQLEDLKKFSKFTVILDVDCRYSLYERHHTIFNWC